MFESIAIHDIEKGGSTTNNNSTQNEDTVEDPTPAATAIRLPSRPDEPISNCAICLEPYQLGDYLVWSANETCTHVFHRQCLVDFLCKVKGEETPCPCCRQAFCNLPNIDDDEMPKDNTHTTNTSQDSASSPHPIATLEIETSSDMP